MTSETVEFTFYTDWGEFSPNKRIHYFRRARLTRKVRDAGYRLWMSSGGPTATGPVEVRYLLRRSRRLDHVNACACVKPFEDALFSATRYQFGITPDDSARWVLPFEVAQETGGAFRAPQVIVTVTGDFTFMFRPLELLSP
jgi:hypothetical protein